MKSDPPTPIDVFEYLNYRDYLRDFYAEQKARGRGFSYRSFAKRAGVHAPNHLKRVMDGQRNLSLDMARKFARGCRLDDEAARFFVQLVRFNQATSTEARSEAYAGLIAFRQYRSAHRLDVAYAAYFSQWFVPAIREMAAQPGFRNDPAWIAKCLVPPITKTQAKRALETLQELGMLEESDDGTLQQAEPLVTTGAEAHQVHVATYHRMMLERAAASIDLVESAERDLSSVTLLVPRGGLQLLKERMRELRRELLQMQAGDGPGARVVQVGIQVYPLSGPINPPEQES